MNSLYPDDLDIAQLKTPPYSLEAEQSVLGGLLIACGAIDSVLDLIAENDFYFPQHRFIFKRIVDLHADNRPFDITVIAGTMNPEELDRIGGFIYLAELSRSTPSVSNIRAYAQAVRERSNLRRLILVGGEICEMGFQANNRSSLELIDEAQRKVLAIGEQQDEAAEIHVSASMTEYLAELDRRAHSGGMAGLATGFFDIDQRTNGLMGGDFIIIAGRPGMGKTTLAMNIAEHVAIRLQKGVLVFSMEMSRIQLIDRMVSSVGKIPFQFLRSGTVFQTNREMDVQPAAAKIRDSKLYIDERGALTVQQMRSTARRQHKKNPVSLIVVDYLQLARAKAENRVNEISAISQALKALAKELNVPLIALSQLSRKCEERQDKRPINSDLRDSGAIEQDADAIFMLYRDEVYNSGTQHKGKTEVHCTKLRNGTMGRDWLASALEICQFQNLSTPYLPENEPVIQSHDFDYK